jgi:CBS domain containing-hemolysin-like protein
MSTPIVWISIEERYEVAKAMMVDKGLRHLVVKDAQDSFWGFVSSRELLNIDLLEARRLVSRLNDDYYEQNFKP